MNDEHDQDPRHSQKGDERPTASVDRDQASAAPRNPARRRLATAGLGGAMLVTLPAKSVWGNQGRCSLSGEIFSANVSDIDHECTKGQGCTPGFWKNNTEAWDCTGFDPGQCIERNEDGTCAVWDAYGAGTRFDAVFHNSPTCAPPYATLMEVLQTCKGRDLDWHAVAAMLNAACNSVEYGATMEDVKQAYYMARTDADTDAELVKDVFDNMNNRGCPIDRWGDCEDGYTKNEADQCIPVKTSQSD
ncbi:hypothetical protein [Thioalkalivibrio sp. ALJ24]|uniref:hypothetical protein n=1 Tax=Thioalkalivibrio sp. ALJ24 TaxID=545276 RepID=UPI0003644343|nr:hypothetical protein [Thioalkalivibrio sp. ALJ24]